MRPGHAGNGVVIKMDLNRAALKADARRRAAGYRPSPILAALIVFALGLLISTLSSYLMGGDRLTTALTNAAQFGPDAVEQAYISFFEHYSVSGVAVVLVVALEIMNYMVSVGFVIFSLHVSRDEQKPFIVKTHRMDIKVLGTQFNVTAYENEANMQVVLVSGKVEVNLDKCKNILAPNQMFSYDSKIHKGKITTVDTDDYVAWKDGYYQFHQQPLKEIVKKLSRYYGVRIYCKEPADKLSCSGKLDLKESLGEMMKALKEAAPIQVENKYESIEIKVKH